MRLSYLIRKSTIVPLTLSSSPLSHKPIHGLQSVNPCQGMVVWLQLGKKDVERKLSGEHPEGRVAWATIRA